MLEREIQTRPRSVGNSKASQRRVLTPMELTTALSTPSASMQFWVKPAPKGKERQFCVLRMGDKVNLQDPQIAVAPFRPESTWLPVVEVVRNIQELFPSFNEPGNLSVQSRTSWTSIAGCVAQPPGATQHPPDAEAKEWFCSGHVRVMGVFELRP